MPPKKKLPPRPGNGVKLGSVRDENGPPGSAERKGSKISTLLKPKQRRNGSSFLSSQSSTSDLENDDGFLFKRSSKPIVNKTNLLGSISESLEHTLVPSKRRGQTSSESQRKKTKSAEPARASARKANLTVKKLVSVVPKSKLLDIDSESDVEGDIEDSIAPLIAPVKKSNGMSKQLRSENDLIGDTGQHPGERVTRSQGTRKTGKITSKPKKAASKTNNNVSNTTKPKNSGTGKPKSAVQKASRKNTKAKSKLQDAGILDIPKELNLTQNTKLRPGVTYGSPGKKEPLQISESPVNRRNKELRAKSNRRSSLSNRGKRTSSIGNGFEVTPHDDVLPTNYYKHLNQDLPEPHRMRQLLTWCFKKQLEADKSHLQKQRLKKQKSEELIASNIAKVIKEEIVRDLVEGRVNTSWWNRSEDISKENIFLKTQPKPKTKNIKVVPNKQNVENEKTLKLFEKRLNKLRNDNDEWDTLYADYDNDLAANKLAIETAEKDQNGVLASEILKLDQINKGKKRVSKIKSEDLAESRLFYSSIIDGSLLSKASKKALALSKEVEKDYPTALDAFSSFVDKLNFNDSVIKNFEYNKKQHIAGIFNRYLANSQPNESSSNNPQDTFVQFDDIELLRGITKIDKP